MTKHTRPRRLVQLRYTRLKKRLAALIAVGLHEKTDPPGMTRWYVTIRSDIGWDVQYECCFGGSRRILTQTIDVSTLKRRDLRHVAQLEVQAVMVMLPIDEYLPHPPLSFYKGPELNY